MYQEFSSLYDIFMENVPYECWCQYLHRFLPRTGIGKSLVLDIACGTGNITRGLFRLGYQMIGADASESMLSVFQEKMRREGVRIPALLMKMEAFSLMHPVDAITCICDGVNYLDKEGVTAFFLCAYDALLPGGMLLFDISTPYRLEHILGDNTFAEDRGEGAYILETHFDGNLSQMDLILFMRLPGQDHRYYRQEEQHILYAHQPLDLKHALFTAGFSHVTQYAFLSEDPPGDGTERIFFVGKK